MAQWYVKDLSRLTDISVQTLHHYDRTGLLKPSIRRPNGYRLYSETDLLRLQQIMALKFFGFKLSHIKRLIESPLHVADQLRIQADFLHEKAHTLLEASHTLKSILPDCKRHGSIPWETIIQLTKVYRMTQHLKNSWEGKVLTREELKQYARFEEDLQKRFTAEGRKKFETTWAYWTDEIKKNLHQDPRSTIGIHIAENTMKLINDLYGPDYANLKVAVWEKGFKAGHGNTEHGLSSDMVKWLDQATHAYYRKRIEGILNRINHDSLATVSQEWDALLYEFCGHTTELNRHVINEALNNPAVNPAAKEWLRTRYKL